MLTQAGSPCIYYGSEIGIDGFKSMTLENNRKCMIWDENKQDLELRQFIRWLIRLRKNIHNGVRHQYNGKMLNILR